jgi:hypothetical protein
MPAEGPADGGYMVIRVGTGRISAKERHLFAVQSFRNYRSLL